MRRDMYPLDVYSEITMSSKSSSSGKKFVVRLILVGLVLLCAIGGNLLLSNLGVPFLGVVLGLIVGIFLSLLVWNQVSEKEESALENPDENKAMKFFRITLGRAEFVKEVPLIEYTNGDKAIILSLCLGNQTAPGQEIAEEFLDNLFHMCQKQSIKFNMFTTIEEWEDSDLHESLLKVYGKCHDPKLKATLFESITEQSLDFSKSKVIQINIIFYDRDFSLTSLRTVIDYVESFRTEGFKLSTFRSLRWNNQGRAVRLFCRFLGIKLIDSSPLADKNAVFLDTKALVRPFVPDIFYSSKKLTSHLTNTMATRVRVPVVKKGD